MKKLLCLFIALAVSLISAPAAAAEEGDPYTDMPSAPWAREAVLKAREYGLMNGVGESEFGTGCPLSRQEFVTVLCRMFGWEAGDDGEDAFDDISDVWGRDYINAAAKNGAVDAGGSFRPADDITRREMAVMLVRALGLSNMASSDLPLPFTDVSEDTGFIAVAYDIDMTNGTSPTTFEPEGGAVREQAAAMLVRVYERYISKTRWAHAFYAISSFRQLELAKRFDAVTLGWSRLVYSEGTALLETTPQNGSVYCVPDGYAEVVAALGDAGVETYLGVFMDGSDGLSAFLADPDARTSAIGSILDEAALLGTGGVTLDLEGLRSGSKDSLTSFAGELDAALEGAGLKLNVAVMPTTADGIYFDGYDYRALGQYADKLILMAHDYAPLSMPENLLGSEFYKNAALTPIASVYRSLRDITDPATGVDDPGKVAINLSMTAMAWETDEAGRLVSALPVYPTMETVRSRILGGAETGWSETFENPYLTYVTESGQSIFLWYEDQRSVEAKLELARLMGVASVSVWRLGLVPEYTDEGLFLDVAGAILGE